MTNLELNWSYKQKPIARSFVLRFPEKPAFVLSGSSSDFRGSDVAFARKKFH